MTQDERNMAGLIHLLGIFSLQIISIIIWAIKKDESEFVNAHGKEFLNFVISTIIYATVSGILCIVIIGIPLLIALVVYMYITMIIATIKAFKGEYYSYPLIIHFIK